MPEPMLKSSGAGRRRVGPGLVAWVDGDWWNTPFSRASRCGRRRARPRAGTARGPRRGRGGGGVASRGASGASVSPYPCSRAGAPSRDVTDEACARTCVIRVTRRSEDDAPARWRGRALVWFPQVRTRAGRSDRAALAGPPPTTSTCRPTRTTRGPAAARCGRRRLRLVVRRRRRRVRASPSDSIRRRRGRARRHARRRAGGGLRRVRATTSWAGSGAVRGFGALLLLSRFIRGGASSSSRGRPQVERPARSGAELLRSLRCVSRRRRRGPYFR